MGTVVVLGGRGVIGGAAVDALRAKGADVAVVTSDASAASGPGVRFGDVLRPETLPGALAGAEVVVQSAQFPTYPLEKPHKGHTFEAFDEIGTRSLVAAARAAGVRRYIFVGGVGAGPQRTERYFRAIWSGADTVLSSGMEAVCVFPAFVFGPTDKGLNRLMRMARRLPVLPLIGDGQQLHQPVFAADVGELIARAVPSDAAQGVFEIGGPERMRYEEMVRRAFAVAGLEKRIVPVPFWVWRAGGMVAERLPRTPATRVAVDFVAEDFVADNTRAVEAFGLRLTGFEDGLRTYLGSGASAPTGAGLLG